MVKVEDKSVPRRERTRMRIHNNILTAAKAGIGRAGIHGITMNEIAIEADISRATLFKYFPSKNDIVTAVADEMQQGFFALIDRCILRSDDPAERVRLVFVTTATALENSSTLSKQFVAISFLALNRPAVPPTVERFDGAFRKMLSTEQLKASPALDLVTDFAAGIFVGLLYRWLTLDPFPLRQRMVAAAEDVAEIITRRTKEGA